MRANTLESEKKVLEAAERRLTQEASDLSQEKFRLSAELEAARHVHSDREAELLENLGKLKDEVWRGKAGGSVYLYLLMKFSTD